MNKQIFIGTGNQGKIKEFKYFLNKLNLNIVTNKDLKIDFDPAEKGEDYLQIATLKAKEWSKKSQLPTLADDSGLSVDYLNGQPGIYSKRFFSGSDQDRNQYLIKLMEGTTQSQRKAHFHCALVFYDLNLDEYWHTVGKVQGSIALKISENIGFGYDPIFIPDGYQKSFADLPEIKSSLSHRANAIAKMIPILRQWI